MNEDDRQKLSDLEEEFSQEVKGEGSLSIEIVPGADNASNGNSAQESLHLSYDINAEDLEALYFEGLSLPRWEDVAGETVEEKRELYLESFEKCTSNYPMIKRVSDIDQKVTFTPDEVLRLHEECQSILKIANTPKSIRAIQKFSLAAQKAADRRMGLRLKPNSFF